MNRFMIFEAKDLASESNRLKKKYGKKILESMLNNEKNKSNLESGKCTEEDMLNVAIEFFNKYCPDTDGGRYASAYMEWMCVRWLGRSHKWREGRDNTFMNRLYAALKAYDLIKFKKLTDRFGLSSNIMDYDEDSLIDVIKSLKARGMMKQLSPNQRTIDKFEGQCELVREYKDAVIYAVYTYPAERVFGSNTSWCTVGNKSYFKKYSPVYYILFPKDSFGVADLNSDIKMQFHYQSDGEIYIMNAEDEDACWEDVSDLYGEDVAEDIFGYLKGHENYFDKGVGIRNDWKAQTRAEVDEYMKKISGFGLDDIVSAFEKAGFKVEILSELLDYELLTSMDSKTILIKMEEAQDGLMLPFEVNKVWLTDGVWHIGCAFGGNPEALAINWRDICMGYSTMYRIAHHFGLKPHNSGFTNMVLYYVYKFTSSLHMRFEYNFVDRKFYVDVTKDGIKQSDMCASFNAGDEKGLYVFVRDILKRIYNENANK